MIRAYMIILFPILCVIGTIQNGQHFCVLPSCWVVNVRAETPSPMSSLVDPISSAFQEWRECLLDWTADLNDKTHYDLPVVHTRTTLNYWRFPLIYLL